MQKYGLQFNNNFHSTLFHDNGPKLKLFMQNDIQIQLLTPVVITSPSSALLPRWLNLQSGQLLKQDVQSIMTIVLGTYKFQTTYLVIFGHSIVMQQVLGYKLLKM